MVEKTRRVGAALLVLAGMRRARKGCTLVDGDSVTRAAAVQHRCRTSWVDKLPTEAMERCKWVAPFAVEWKSKVSKAVTGPRSATATSAAAAAVVVAAANNNFGQGSEEG